VSEPPELPPKNVEQVQIEDYGIFGDDDGEDEDDYEYDDDYRDRKPVLEDQNISRIQGKEEISNASSPEPVTFESESTRIVQLPFWFFGLFLWFLPLN
jgi:hypothetical protein